MKKHIRILDIPNAVPANEVEAMLNTICGEGYYSERYVQTGLPDGIAMRVFFRLRKEER